MTSTTPTRTPTASPVPRPQVSSSASTRTGSLDRLAAAGLIEGFGDGRVGPQRELTRVQLASLAAWVFDHVEAAR